MQDCVFCKIAAKEIPVKAIYEDDRIIAFPDMNPVAPVHILVIPKKHIADLLETTAEDAALMAHLMIKIPEIAGIAGIADDGFRLVFNTKKNGGQTVYHMHYHMLGGRFMTWPPG